MPAATAAAAPPEEPSGGEREVPRVARRARQARLCRWREPEFRRRRLAEYDDAGLP